MSSAEGQKFADTVSEMTEKIKGLGPNPINKNGSSPSIEEKDIMTNANLPDPSEADRADQSSNEAQNSDDK